MQLNSVVRCSTRKRKGGRSLLLQGMKKKWKDVQQWPHHDWRNLRKIRTIKCYRTSGLLVFTRWSPLSKSGDSRSHMWYDTWCTASMMDVWCRILDLDLDRFRDFEELREFRSNSIWQNQGKIKSSPVAVLQFTSTSKPWTSNVVDTSTNDMTSYCAFCPHFFCWFELLGSKNQVWVPYPLAFFLLTPIVFKTNCYIYSLKRFVALILKYFKNM